MASFLSMDPGACFIVHLDYNTALPTIMYFEVHEHIYVGARRIRLVWHGMVSYLNHARHRQARCLRPDYWIHLNSNVKSTPATSKATSANEVPLEPNRLIMNTYRNGPE